MSRLVMLPMRDKRQCFCWFRRSGRWFVSACLRSVGAPRYSAVKNSRSRYLAVVGGLTQESGRLHGNNAVPTDPDIRPSWRPQSGGCWPVVRLAWSAAGVGREDNRQSQPVSQRRLMALSPPRRPPTWRRSVAKQGLGRTWRQSKLSVRWEARMTFPNPPPMPRCVSLESRSVTKSQTGASWRLAKNLCSRLSTRYRW
jgi:hypothetical protein